MLPFSFYANFRLLGSIFAGEGKSIPQKAFIQKSLFFRKNRIIDVCNKIDGLKKNWVEEIFIWNKFDQENNSSAR